MRTLLLPALVCGFAAALLVESAIGQSLPDETAVESSREMLRERADFPWYDAEQDDLKRLDVSPPKDLENRFSKWETKPAGTMPDWVTALLRVLGWVIVGVAILLVVLILVRALLWNEVTVVRGTRWKSANSAEGVIERVGKLPFSLQVTQADLLAEARRCFDAGDYAQSIIFLYSYQLVQLDKSQLIRLSKGKTNRQYLFEMRRRPKLRSLLETSMIAFEDVFFGRHALERSRFEHCWRTLDEFHQLLEQADPAAL